LLVDYIVLTDAQAGGEATIILCSFPASSEESEGQQLKQCVVVNIHTCSTRMRIDYIVLTDAQAGGEVCKGR
jgi:hypothetical protein